MFGELLIGVENLPHACRTNRMAVGDQTSARVDWNFERKFAALFIAHLRQGGRAALDQIDALPRLGQPKDFVSDNLGNRETIVYLSALNILGLQVRHRKCLLGSFARR